MCLLRQQCDRKLQNQSRLISVNMGLFVVVFCRFLFYLFIYLFEHRKVNIKHTCSTYANLDCSISLNILRLSEYFKIYCHSKFNYTFNLACTRGQ